MPSMEELYSNPDLFLNGGEKVETAEFSNLKEKVKAWANRVISDYKRYGTDLNKQIADIASRNNLNNETISRIVEEVNTEVYLHEYEKKKPHMMRNVEFAIADSNKIKDILGNNSVANIETIEEANTEDGAMVKAASSKYAGDPLNAFNYRPYNTGSLELKSRYSREDILKMNITEKLAAELDEIQNGISAYEKEVNTIAHALIKYAKHNVDVQGVFEKMCKEASLTKVSQNLIRNVVKKDKETEALLKKMPAEATKTDPLELVDAQGEPEVFNLGSKTLMVVPSTTRDYDVPATEEIAGIKELIEAAIKVQQGQEDIMQKVARHHELEQKLLK